MEKLVVFENSSCWFLVKRCIFDDFFCNTRLSNFSKIFAIRIMLYIIYRYKISGEPQRIAITLHIKKLLLGDFQKSNEERRLKRELKNKNLTISKNGAVKDFFKHFGISLETAKDYYPHIEVKQINNDNIKINQTIDAEFRKGYRWIYIPTFMLINKTEIIKSLYFRKSRQCISTDILCSIIYGLSKTELTSRYSTGGVLTSKEPFKYQTEKIVILNSEKDFPNWYGIRLVHDGQTKQIIESMFFSSSDLKINQERKYLYFLTLRCCFFKKDRYTDYNKDNILLALQKLAEYFKADAKFSLINTSDLDEYDKEYVLKNLNRAKNALNKQETSYSHQIQNYVKECAELPEEITTHLLERIKKQII